MQKRIGIILLALLFLSKISFGQSWLEEIGKEVIRANKVTKIEVWTLYGQNNWLSETLFFNLKGELIELRYGYIDSITFYTKLFSFDTLNQTKIIKYINPEVGNSCPAGDGPLPNKKIQTRNDQGQLLNEVSYWNFKDQFNDTVKQKFTRIFHYNSEGFLTSVKTFSDNDKQKNQVYSFKYFFN